MGRFDGCCKLTDQNFLKRWCYYVFIAFIIVVVITGIILLVLRLAFKPHVEASIEDVRLTTFRFATTETTLSPFLEYNISVAISIHNPTWGIVKNTKPLVAAIAFHDNSLLNVSVAGEGHRYRPSKKKVYLLHESGEVPWDVLGRTALEDFKEENKTAWGLIMLLMETSVTLASAARSVCSSRRLAMESSSSMRSIASLSPRISILPIDP